METRDKAITVGFFATGLALAAALLWPRPPAVLAGLDAPRPRRKKRQVPDSMIEHIAVANSEGKTPKQGWFYWLSQRYTPEAVQEFLEVWHEATCDIAMVKKVKNALGMQTLPEHVQKFGQFMLWKARQTLRPEDVAKAYSITLSSIQRSAIDAGKLRRTWFDHPFEGKVRPEDAFAYLLYATPEGQAFVSAAAKGEFNDEAARSITEKFRAFSRPNQLHGQLRHAPTLAARAAEINTLLRYGSKEAWTRFVIDSVHGIKAAKSGFLASLLGRGDIPTADAREHDVWAPDLAVGKGKGLPFEYVEYIAERLRSLDVQMPSELRPFYQHLVHHAVWDKTANAETSHREIVKCMAADALAADREMFLTRRTGSRAPSRLPAAVLNGWYYRRR